VIEKRVIHLVHDDAKERAAAAMRDPVYHGCKVTISPPAKTRPQEERAHAMIGDISEQVRIFDRLWDEETIKRLCVDQFRRDTSNDPDFKDDWESMGIMEVMPSLDGRGVVSVGWQTRRFSKKLYGGFIEWLFSFGASHEVVWSEKAKAPK